MTDETRKHGHETAADEARSIEEAAEAAAAEQAGNAASDGQTQEPDPMDVLRAENSELRDRYLRQQVPRANGGLPRAYPAADSR